MEILHENFNFKCGLCEMEQQELKAANSILEPPEFGSLIVCGGCGAVNEVKLLGLEAVPEDKIALLDAGTQADIAFARRACRRQLRNQ